MKELFVCMLISRPIHVALLFTSCGQS